MIAERDGPGLLRFDTLAGPVAVRTSPTRPGLTATLTSVPTRTRPGQAAELDAAPAALRWRGEDLDPRYPAHVAYAGNDHLILAARDRARLAALDYDYPALGKLMARKGWTTVHLVWAKARLSFTPATRSLPVTWSKTPPPEPAAAAFGGYLRALALVDIPARVTILQGEGMGRPSRLLVDLAAGDERVHVTGTADPIPAG